MAVLRYFHQDPRLTTVQESYVKDTRGTDLTSKLATINTSITNNTYAIEDKQDQIPGKSLSTNDFTDYYKNKLISIEEGAEVNVQADWTEEDDTADSYIKHKPTTLAESGITDVKIENNTIILGEDSIAIDTVVTENSDNLITSGAVYDAIDALPEPMIFKGSLGVGGTITQLPTASSSNIGYVYKVITDGTYDGQLAESGDSFISDGSQWVRIPSGDEPEGTVTNVAMTVPTGLQVSGSPITSSGTLSITYAVGYAIPTIAKQEAWDDKQDAISDLATIRSNASEGHTAYGWGDHSLAGYQMAISDLATIRSNASEGHTAYSWGDHSQQGYVKSSGVTSVSMTVPTGLLISGIPITSTGTLALSFADGYSIPTNAKQSNWDTAYNWGNHANAGYVKSSGVTSVEMTVPTGFSITGSPITTTGTLALTFANGYSLPTTQSQSNWDTAYGWGNHASVGYALASLLSNYLPLIGGTMLGDISMGNAHSITNLGIGGGIYWNPYVESPSDGTDGASITVVSSGVAGGTTLIISLQNDDGDTILFATNPSAVLYHNDKKIWDEYTLTKLSQLLNDPGYITGISSSDVVNALGYTPPTQNTWRPITDTYTGSDTGTSVSLKGTNDLYNALLNGYASSAGDADTVDGYHYNNLPYLHDNGGWIPDTMAALGATYFCGLNRDYAYMGFAANSSDMHVFTDGKFWQREGAYYCLDNGNTYVSNGTGVINNDTITLVSNADTVDGYHENSFLRFRGLTSVSGEATLWDQIGIKQYEGVYPEGISTGYTYGSVISLPGIYGRFDLWANHLSSDGGGGLQYRTGWATDKRRWLTILDSANYTAYTDNRFVFKVGDTMTGHLKMGGTANLSSPTWDPGIIAGLDGHSKVVLTYLASVTNGAVIGAHNSSLSAWDVLNISGTDIIFRNGETERMRLTSSGNFGIGTNSPTAKLDIAGNFKFVTGLDIPEVSGNLANYANAAATTFYRNGFLIPGQADVDVCDGGFLRVRGTTESTVVLELGTWDDLGTGETIQFNYYPTSSTITPTYSLSVPKASGHLLYASYGDIYGFRNEAAGNQSYYWGFNGGLSETYAVHYSNMHVGYADYADYLTDFVKHTRVTKDSSNNEIESVTGYKTTGFLQIQRFCPPSMYRTTEDMPAPYGIGFGNGSESGGIMPIGSGDYLQDIIFYGANSGPTYFRFGRQIWEGDGYDDRHSNRYETYAYIDSTNGRINSNSSYRLKDWGSSVSDDNSISGYAGTLYFGGNFHIDSQNGLNLYLNYYSGADTYINAQGNGNVGIGTTSPSYKLDVNGDIRSSGNIFASYDIYLARYLYMPDSSGNWVSTIDRSGSNPIFGWGQGQAGHTVYYNGGSVNINAGSNWYDTASGIYINAANNVGIGTNSPSEKLHVNGAIYAAGSLILSQNNATGGGIILADDGDIVDLNDGYCSMRFSNGVRLYTTSRGGSVAQEINANGVLYNYGVYHKSYGSSDYFLTSDAGVKHVSDIGIWTRTITVAGDSNTYYPVKIPATRDKRKISTISVWKNLGSPTASYPENHPDGSSSCWYEFVGRANYWDGNGGYYYTRRLWHGYAQLLSHAEAPGSSIGELIVWLRGGGTEYNISTNYSIGDPTIYYSRANASDSDQYPSYVEPRTGTGNGGILGRQYYGDISGTARYANQLTAARIIWGQLFDGTNNVSGTISNVSNIEFTALDANSGHGGYLDFHYNGSSSDYTSRIIEDSSGRLSFNYVLYALSDKVGIGTNNPETRLHVTGRITSEYDSTYLGGFCAKRTLANNLSYATYLATNISGFGILATGQGGSGSATVRISMSPYTETTSPYIMLDNFKVKQTGTYSVLQVQHPNYTVDHDIIKYGGSTDGASDLIIGEDSRDTHIQGRDVYIDAANNHYNALFIDNSTGNVAINNTSSPYGNKLHVNGDCDALQFIAYSDVRLKDIQSYLSVPIEDIANAPLFLFKWKESSDQSTRVGTSAQYWRDKIPELVREANDDIGTLALLYDVLGVLSGITLAKEILQLKEEIKQLQALIAELKLLQK